MKYFDLSDNFGHIVEIVFCNIMPGFARAPAGPYLEFLGPYAQHYDAL